MSHAHVIDSKPLVADRRETLRTRVATLAASGVVVRLVAVSVGDDPRGLLINVVRQSGCAAVGIEHVPLVLPAESTQADDLDEVIERLNADPEVHAIIQAPLPQGLLMVTGCSPCCPQQRMLRGSTRLTSDWCSLVVQA